MTSDSQHNHPRFRFPSLRHTLELWHTFWVLALLGGLLVVLTVYYDPAAMDTSMVPRVRGLLATLMAAVLLLLLPTSAGRVDLSVLRDPLIVCYAIFTALCFAVLPLALNPTAGFTDAFKTFGIFIFLCLLCLLLPTIARWPDRLLQVAACGGAVSAGWGIYETTSLLGPGWHSRDAMTNVTGTMANVNLYAGFLILALPLGLCGAVLLRGGWRALAALAASGCFAMIVLLQTRAAYLGLAASLAVVLLLAIVFSSRLGLGPKLRRGLVAVAVAAPLLVSAFVLLAPDSNPLAMRLRSLGSGAEDASFWARFMIWDIALRMIGDHFPWGVGTGNFTLRLDEYFSEQTGDFRGQGTNWTYPHNDFFRVLVEQGLAGLISFVAIFALAFWHSFVALIRGKSPRECWLALAVIMLLTAYAVDSFFGFPLARVSQQVYFAVALALAVLLARESRSHPPQATDERRRPYPWSLAVASVPVLAVLVLGFSYCRAAIKQEFYLPFVFALEQDQMWDAALRVLRGAESPWKTIDALNTPWAYHEARLLEQIGTQEETLAALERAYRQNPNRVYVINDLGSYYAKAGRFDDAIALFEKTLQRYPHEVTCAENLALCHIDRGDYASALAVLEGIPGEKRTESMLQKLEICRQQLQPGGGEAAPAAP
jgi:O-antigen ligase